jgi:hypothetical protein
MGGRNLRGGTRAFPDLGCEERPGSGVSAPALREEIKEQDFTAGRQRTDPQEAVGQRHGSPDNRAVHRLGDNGLLEGPCSLSLPLRHLRAAGERRLHRGTERARCPAKLVTENAKDGAGAPISSSVAVSANGLCREAVGELFDDAVCKDVREGKDLGEHLVEGGDVGLPLAFHPGHGLVLGELQVDAQDVDHVVLHPARVGPAERVRDLFCVLRPQAVLLLEPGRVARRTSAAAVVPLEPTPGQCCVVLLPPRQGDASPARRCGLLGSGRNGTGRSR